jgi:hypothetical protein
MTEVVGPVAQIIIGFAMVLFGTVQYLRRDERQRRFLTRRTGAVPRHERSRNWYLASIFLVPSVILVVVGTIVFVVGLIRFI